MNPCLECLADKPLFDQNSLARILECLADKPLVDQNSLARILECLSDKPLVDQNSLARILDLADKPLVDQNLSHLPEFGEPLLVSVELTRRCLLVPLLFQKMPVKQKG